MRRKCPTQGYVRRAGQKYPYTGLAAAILEDIVVRCVRAPLIFFNIMSIGNVRRYGLSPL